MHDFPANLDAFQCRTAGRVGNSENLALNHTLLGYFLPLASAALATAVMRRLHEGAMPELKMKLGITASRIGGHHPLKGCQSCFDEDDASVGFAYWHVEHQFPSVMVCRRHQRPLVIAWDPVTPVHRRGWILPVGGLARRWINISVHDGVQMERLLRLAAFSSRFGGLPPSSLDSIALARTYQAALRGRRLATAGGNLRLSALIEATRTHYRGVETIPGFEALQAVTPDWPGLAGALTRRKPRPGHPLKHLLLIAMLFDSWEEFLLTYEANVVVAPEPTHPAPEVTDDTVSNTFYELVSGGQRSIRAASAEVGISTTTGVKWARRMGLPYTSRAKIFSEEKVAAARSLLQRGHLIATVAELVGMSRVSVNRLLGSDPNLEDAWKTARFLASRKRARDQFQQFVRQNPLLLVRQIRRLPGNGYMWLYRNDREWLRGHLPALWQNNPPKTGSDAAS